MIPGTINNNDHKNVNIEIKIFNTKLLPNCLNPPKILSTLIDLPSVTESAIKLAPRVSAPPSSREPIQPM